MASIPVARAATRRTTKAVATRAKKSTTALPRTTVARTAAPASTAATSPASTSPAATTTEAVREIDWGACDDVGAPLRCGRLLVPMAPGSQKLLSLALIRVPATSADTLGVVFMNPGGPGASGRDFARQIAGSPTLAKIRERYDLIGWDPRGVGRSAPVRCADGPAMDAFFHVDPNPDDPAEVDALVAASKEFIAGCATRSGDLALHVSTSDTIDDIERIRRAIGVERISFLGFSYGTYMALRYADRYPDRVDKFVLDGVLDPSLSALDRVRAQGEGFDREIARFFEQCGSGCKFRDDGQSPAEGFDALMARIDESPIPVRTTRATANGTVKVTRMLGPGEAWTGVLAGLYNVSSGWPRLRAALNAAHKGDGAALLALFDRYTDRAADGSFSNVSEANAAVNCMDLAHSGDASTYRAEAERLGTAFPRFGPYAIWSDLLCLYWPVKAPEPARLAKAKVPMLLVGTTRDPATPYLWAVSVQRQLESSVLLTYDGDGHTALLAGSRCVKSAVERFMLEGRLPAPDTVCSS